MAKYHFEAGLVGRGGKHKSKSAIAKAAYNSRETLKDERTGKSYSWSRLGEAEFAGIFLPKDAPQEWHQLNEKGALRQPLWQELENQEDKNRRRDTALLSRTFIIGIPEEFDTKEKRERFVIDYGRQLARQGWIADLCVHPPETDKRNYHIHAQLPLREIGPDGFGKRINLWGKESGIKRDMSHDEELASQKEMFLKLAARHLRRYGFDLEADRFLSAHQTLDKQKAAAEKRGDLAWARELDREPTIHMGPEAWAMEKDGVRTRKGDINREINKRNYVRQNGHQWGRTNDADLRDGARQDAHDQAFPPRENPWQNGKDDVRHAWRQSPTADAFQKAIEDQGYLLCRVTKPEVEVSVGRNEDYAKAGKYSPKYREGEYVVMDESQRMFRLTPDTTGKTFKEINEFVKPLDKQEVRSISEGSRQMHDRAEAFQRQQEMFARLSNPTPLRKDPQVPRSARPGAEYSLPSMSALNRAAERAAGLGLRFNAAGRTAGKVADVVADLLTGPFAKILTPKQKAEGRQADREKEARGAEVQRQRGWEAETAEEKRRREERNNSRDR